ncbi:MAG: 4-hydroxy-tetrahydrodipicolinate reductase [Bacillota bacterium]|nr:4-hydroxy-tetrahydrodipicolinate reductase [Bacillota bacterium]
MIRVAVIGVGGRMGSLIAKLIGLTTDLRLEIATEQAGQPLVGKVLDLPGNPTVVEGLTMDLSTVDAVVDFTVPSSTMMVLQQAQLKKCAAVVGTTGFSPEQMAQIHKISEDIPVLLSPNMSIGVNMFFRTVQDLAKRLDGYDVEVIEVHHRHKKDAPSGTAKRILEMLGREVPCHSLRIGGVVGEHQVHFAGNGERVTLTHQAESRETFAQGALLAIRFICQQTPGLYTMFDVLDAL